MLTTSDDRSIRLWDATAPQPAQACLAEHEREVVCIAVADQLLGTSSRDKCAKSWHLNEGRLQDPMTIQTHTDWINFVVFLGTSTCCTVCEDRTMYLWALEEGAWHQTASAELEVKVTAAASVADEYICFGDSLGYTTIISLAAFDSTFAKYEWCHIIALTSQTHCFSARRACATSSIFDLKSKGWVVASASKDGVDLGLLTPASQRFDKIRVVSHLNLCAMALSDARLVTAERSGNIKLWSSVEKSQPSSKLCVMLRPLNALCFVQENVLAVTSDTTVQVRYSCSLLFLAPHLSMLANHIVWHRPWSLLDPEPDHVHRGRTRRVALRLLRRPLLELCVAIANICHG